MANPVAGGSGRPIFAKVNLLPNFKARRLPKHHCRKVFVLKGDYFPIEAVLPIGAFDFNNRAKARKSIKPPYG